MRASLALLAVFVLFIASPAAVAVNVTIEYQDPTNPFFTPTAKATIQRAADDISYAITSGLAALNQSDFTGVNGTADTTVEWGLLYTNPDTGAQDTLYPSSSFAFAMDEFRVVVGSRSLDGSTLGQGGPAGAEFILGGSTEFAVQWAGAVANMESASNAAMVRGGPVLDSFVGNFDLNDVTPATYTLDTGFTLGSLVFNEVSPWNLDYDVLPAPGQNDLYSVAVHEMIHAMGFGVGLAWDENLVGFTTNWTGENVIELLGTGIDVLFADQAHIKNGLLGRPLIDGVFGPNADQEAIMDPSLVVGTRKYITDLDLAFLADMGWEVVAVPEPTSILLVLAGGAAILLAIRRRGASS